MREFERRAEKVAHSSALRTTQAKLVRDMEDAIREAERVGAPEAEIEDLAVLALEVTRKIMAAREDAIRTLEADLERMAGSEGVFARRLSGDDRASTAS
ncbi:MAG: hypothetical protein M3R38_22565 [Actinomycetota bacterium]|nr:hypothetical protein [Actinomycetota bacterium]